jgi:putative ABC transport system permease protein
MSKHSHPAPFLIWENFVLALEALRDRPFRSLLTIMGVFIGVVIIVGVASVLNGFRQGIVDVLKGFGTNNVYVNRVPQMMMGGARSHDIWHRKRFYLREVEGIRDECPAVQTVAPVLRIEGPWVTLSAGNEKMVGPITEGSWPEMMSIIEIDLDEGRFYTSEENARRVPVCVIGVSVVEALFPKARSAVGREITLWGKRLRVIGVLKKFPNALSFSNENPQDSVVMMPYNVFRQFFPWQKDIAIIARAKEGYRAQALEQIEEILRRKRQLRWNEDNDFEMETPDSIIEKFDKMTSATVAVMFALSTVAFLVGGVGVMNVMLASVKERTREIGVRRAIGARRRDITWQFLVEAMALTGVGGLTGVIMGEVIMHAIKTWVPAVPCATPMWARVFGFVGSVSVGLVFGLWPAMKAAKLDPIEALRYE